MSPALSWILVATVVGTFVLVFSRLLRFVDDLLDERWLRRHSNLTGYYGHYDDREDEAA